MIVVRGGKGSPDIDAVVFDKDGTLIDLDAAWADRARQWLDQLAGDVPGALSLVSELADRMGLDLTGPRIVPGGVVAAGTMGDLVECIEKTLTAEAVEIPDGYLVNLVASGESRIVPKGDVRAVLDTLTAAGLRCGVLTSDQRGQTESDLDEIGATPHLSGVVCADDGYPPKPDPAGFLALVASMGVPANRALMVGDSPGDEEVARRAGAFGFVAVGEGLPNAVETVGDLVVP